MPTQIDATCIVFIMDTAKRANLLMETNAQVSLNESLAWAVLRSGTVSIGGTDYSPPVPIELDVKEELEKILSISEKTSCAIRLMLWIMRSQLYWEGNKRTAAICEIMS